MERRVHPDGTTGKPARDPDVEETVYRRSHPDERAAPTPTQIAIQQWQMVRATAERQRLPLHGRVHRRIEVENQPHFDRRRKDRRQTARLQWPSAPDAL